MNQKLLKIVLSVFVVCLAGGTLFAQNTVVTLVHVNDTHSHLDATGPRDFHLDGTVGGLAKAAGVITDIRNHNPNVLLLHAGDVFTGDFFFNKFWGIAEFQLMQKLGFDAMTVGNHEFDLGPEMLAYSVNPSNGLPGLPSFSLPLLSANLDFSACGSPECAYLHNRISPAVLKTVGGLKIGIFGMTVPNNPTTHSGDVAILGGDNPAVLFGIAETQVESLRAEGAQVVICLSHLGLLYDQALAAYVGGIDIIVGGHDHYEFSQPLAWDNVSGGKTYYVQAGSHYEKVGKMRFTFNQGMIRNIEYSLIPVDRNVRPQPEYGAIVETLKAQIVQQWGDVYHTPVSFALGDITTYNGKGNPIRDTGMGNLVTDAMRDKTGTDIAITANGLIAEGISRGAIVGADIFRPLSYVEDTTTLGLDLVTFKIDALNLITGMEATLSMLGINEDFLLQVSGLRFAYDPTKPVGQRVILPLVFIGGKPLNPAKLYTVTANVGVAALLPLLGVNVSDERFVGQTDYAVLKDYIKHRPLLFSSPQLRIVELKSSALQAVK